ncbi:MAG: pyridoxal phosphate-dependent aminotransferase [Alphaproteobacteria bacterium]|nr:pyridoxal phosphate-dependent aminotransferase [Alphaproteobacteria bacterium]
MSFISERVSRIKPSSTIAMNQKAIELKEAGHDIISLSAGEPDFDTPESIKEAAMAAIRSGQTKYTAVDGTTELKQAIIKKFKKENDLVYQLDQITVGSGGKQVIYNAMFATLNENDEVIIPTPYWVSYPDIVMLAGGTPIFIPCSRENNFKLSPADLDQAITPRTKWIIFNSPSNPTGTTYSKDEIKALADILLEPKNQHVWILTDDIYEHLTYDNFAFYTMAQVEPKLFNRCLTVNGVSKAYCMTGWRIGYAGGPIHLIKTMAKIQSQSTSNPSSISQAAAVAALNGPQHFIAEHNKIFCERRNLLVDALSDIKGLSCNKALGAFYLYVNCEKMMNKTDSKGQVIKSDDDFVIFLLDQAKIAVVAGSGFGLSPYFRISYALSTERLKDAIIRLRTACLSLV